VNNAQSEFRLIQTAGNAARRPRKDLYRFHFVIFLAPVAPHAGQYTAAHGDWERIHAVNSCNDSPIENQFLLPAYARLPGKCGPGIGAGAAKLSKSVYLH
jgi:hypothetical protein